MTDWNSQVFRPQHFVSRKWKSGSKGAMNWAFPEKICIPPVKDANFLSENCDRIPMGYMKISQRLMEIRGAKKFLLEILEDPRG